MRVDDEELIRLDSLQSGAPVGRSMQWAGAEGLTTSLPRQMAHMEELRQQGKFESAYGPDAAKRISDAHHEGKAIDSTNAETLQFATSSALPLSTTPSIIRP